MTNNLGFKNPSDGSGTQEEEQFLTYRRESKNSEAYKQLCELLYSLETVADILPLKKKLHVNLQRIFGSSHTEVETESAFRVALGSMPKKRPPVWAIAKDIIQEWQTLEQKEKNKKAGAAAQVDWMEFDIKKIETLGDTVTFYRDGEGGTFTIAADKILNQDLVRSAFYNSCNVKLPKLKQDAYETVIFSIEKTRSNAHDADVLIRNALFDAMVLKAYKSEGTEEIAKQEAARDKGYVCWEGRMFFSIFRLIEDLESMKIRKFSPSLVQSELDRMEMKGHIINNVMIYTYEPDTARGSTENG